MMGYPDSAQRSCEERVRPVGHRVLVKKLKAPVLYKNLLHLPDPSQHVQSNNGIVYRIGTKVENIIPGEWVVFNRLYAQDVEDDYALVDSRYCIAVLASDHEVSISVYLAAARDTLPDEWTARTTSLQMAGFVVVNTSPTITQWGRSIRQAEAFVALDCTTPSVILQTGYALAHRKPIFMCGKTHAENVRGVVAPTLDELIPALNRLRGLNNGTL